MSPFLRRQESSVLKLLFVCFIILFFYGCNELKSRKAYSIDGIYIGDYISKDIANKLIDYTWNCSDLSCIPKSKKDKSINLDIYKDFKEIESVDYVSKNKGAYYKVSVFKYDAIYLVLVLDIDPFGKVNYINHYYVDI